MNTRRVRLALGKLFGGTVSKDTVSRAWRRVQGDFESWNRRRLEGEPIVRLILDGTVVHVGFDRQSTALSILVALGVRADGQKVLLGLRALAGERGGLARSAAGPRVSWPEPARAGHHRRRQRPGGGAGRRCGRMRRCSAVRHKLRNLIAHAPKNLHDELAADYSAMMCAGTPALVLARRQFFFARWHLRCPRVARSLEVDSERLHEEFKPRIRTQCVLPCADTACMMFWALLASG